MYTQACSSEWTILSEVKKKICFPKILLYIKLPDNLKNKRTLLGTRLCMALAEGHTGHGQGAELLL